MSAWWTGAALGFDTETDGPEPTEARIITAAMVLVTPDFEPNAMELMIQPERDIPAKATAIHGISTERAREEGALREVGIPQIAMTIAELANEYVPLVGQNVSYDLTLLDRELRRLGLGHLSTSVDTGFCSLTLGTVRAEFPVIDTYVLDKAVDKYRKGKRRLEPMAEHYGVPMAAGAAHGATADVFAALRIAYKIARRADMAADYVTQHGADPMSFQHHPFMRFYAGRRDPLEIVKTFAALGAMNLSQLMDAQARWSREQAKSLRDYFIESGTGDPDGVDGRWPVRPLTAAHEVVETTVL